LPPGSWFPNLNRVTIAIQLWVVHAGNEIIVVDTGVGNRKTRPVERMHMLNSLLPHWLAAAGAAPASVTHVLMTPFHSDHVGWNTTLDGARWVPTFKNARYLLPRSDFEFFKGRRDRGEAPDTSFDDSVIPVVDAGLADFIDARSELPGGLRPVEAFGHTPGMMNYWLRSRGETGVLSADVLHHPAQILNPSLNTAFCMIPDAARNTRAALLAEAAATGALVMPCHFSAPFAGFVRRDGNGYRFQPATPGFPGP
jgi:glyoxylase-like metal-dependent hydrolase (beta-lactamase superfamily II)